MRIHVPLPTGRNSRPRRGTVTVLSSRPVSRRGVECPASEGTAMKSILLLLCFVPLAAVAAEDSKADETAIRKLVQEEVAAWNASDAIAYSRHFAEDGTFTNIRGEFYSGY